MSSKRVRCGPNERVSLEVQHITLIIHINKSTKARHVQQYTIFSTSLFLHHGE